MAIEIYHNAVISVGQTTRYLLYSTEGFNDYDIIPGVIKQEVNKAGSFEFDMYSFDIYSATGNLTLEEGYSYISVEDTQYNQSSNNRYLFYGRIISIDRDLSWKIHATCEGILALLTDIPLYMPSSAQSSEDSKYGIWHLNTKYTSYLFQYAMGAYKEGNKAISSFHEAVGKILVLGSVDSENNMENETDSGSSDDEWFSYEYPWSQSVGDFIVSDLLSKYGGILELVYDYDSRSTGVGIYATLNWRADPVSNPNRYSVGTQEIKYGENVLDAKLEKTDTSAVEGIFAVGKRRKSGSNNPDDGYTVPFFHEYKDSSTGHYHPVFDLPEVAETYIGTFKTVNFDHAHSDSMLKKMAKRYLLTYCSNYNYTVTAKVLDKHFMGENVDRIKVMGKYNVWIPFPGKTIHAYLFCLSSEIDITNPANNTYTFGQYVPPETLDSKWISKGK